MSIKFYIEFKREGLFRVVVQESIFQTNIGLVCSSSISWFVWLVWLF